LINKEEILAVVSTEIEQARTQHRLFSAIHNTLISLNIIVGALTAYLAAIGYDAKAVVAGLATLVTLLGTFEKTFGFGAKKHGYREVKTRFQNLELEITLCSQENLGEIYSEKLLELRSLKAALTS
tara:strand:- start:127 stop:504 length:378 start_codon:yes stop_codon:yes gene_type:complete